METPNRTKKTTPSSRGSSPKSTRRRLNPPPSPPPTPAPKSWVAPPPLPDGSWTVMESVPPPVAPPGCELFLWLPDHKDVALVASYPPFVISLAAGNLDPAKFQDSLSQQMLFLSCFADTFELAELLCDDTLFKDMLHDIKCHVFEERDLCWIALEELNINPMKHIVPTPAIVKYANFIRGTAVGIVDHRKGSEHVEICLEKKQITAYTLSAISPYMRFNASLGKHFGSVCTHANKLHPFRKWIDAYTNGNFELVVDQMEDMLHRITEQLTDKDLEIISCLYHQALRYELEILADQIVSLHDPLHLSGLQLRSDFHEQ